jgi:F-type H+-transporting ATPase subunit b
MGRVIARWMLSTLAVASLLLLAVSAFASGGGEREGGEHGAHGGHGVGEINWYHGMVAEREGAEPSLLWREKGTPPPVLAMVLNTAVLFYLIGKYGAPKMSEALKKRKVSIMQGMNEAQKMKEDAEERLEDYEEKLKHIDDEIERVKREMRAAGEAERVRVLAEAREKRVRLERDAMLLIDQELNAARELLMRETVRSAVSSAQDLLTRNISVNDQHRLTDEYIKGVAGTLGSKS